MEKWFYAVILAAAMAGTYALTFKLGALNGALEVQSAWDEAEKKREDKIGQLQTDYATRQGEHEQKVKELTDALQTTTDEHQKTLDGYRLEYDRRLQLATSRAGVYQRQAQGTASERDRLAEHAAGLDRALEEGRGLVRELGETLGQRDRTIRELGKLIQSQQSLLSDPQ